MEFVSIATTEVSDALGASGIPTWTFVAFTAEHGSIIESEAVMKVFVRSGERGRVQSVTVPNPFRVARSALLQCVAAALLACFST